MVVYATGKFFLVLQWNGLAQVIENGSVNFEGFTAETQYYALHLTICQYTPELVLSRYYRHRPFCGVSASATEKVK